MLKRRTVGNYAVFWKGTIYLALLMAIYLLTNIDLGNYLTRTIISILIWAAVIVIVTRTPKDPIEIKRSLIENVYIMVFGFVLLYFIIYFSLGLIDGFGKSPYNHNPKVMAINLSLLFTSIWGRELIRSKVLYHFRKVNRFLLFIIVALIFTFVRFELNRYTCIDSLQELIQFVAEYFLPEFTINYLACYLVAYAGPYTAILFIGSIDGVKWIAPVLPNLQWISKGFIGIMLPLTLLMYIEYKLPKFSRREVKKVRDEEHPMSWIATSIVSIAIIWFSVGVFPIYPSVIVTGSMEPEISVGDVILVKKLGEQSIDIGDVIQFTKRDIDISHRVIDMVSHDDGQIGYITKGDNNNIADKEEVMLHEIKGKIVYTVPKAGLLRVVTTKKSEADLEAIDY